MEPRQRGNPPGNTNQHVAANLRRTRQGIGLDVRSLSARIKAAGRAISPSAISKIENGDRRVDVDDLAVLAFALSTTPADLLTPPEGADAPTGLPEQFNAEELRSWVEGRTALTDDALTRYWTEQGNLAAAALYRAEETLRRIDAGHGGTVEREPYESAAGRERERLDLANARRRHLDPTLAPIEPLDIPGYTGDIAAITRRIRASE
ncbi:helix-turn-helix transcriptional regulator [Gryllotalpicola sp.]|uniref:helix-turn-helix domain-containing protein n=1 Tax=Gryllotalpicola sp. TaxID=1932787 RepID=UPI00261497B1|nr:helix-turn-helix transcriptional regulator [Gryllotalpicola sp.]